MTCFVCCATGYWGMDVDGWKARALAAEEKLVSQPMLGDPKGIHHEIAERCTLAYCPQPHRPAPREDGPGIARLPEPRPEPLAFLDEDLLADDA